MPISPLLLALVADGVSALPVSYVERTRGSQSSPETDWLYSLLTKMEKLYTVRKKQDRELTVAQIMISLLPNSDLS